MAALDEEIDASIPTEEGEEEALEGEEEEKKQEGEGEGDKKE